jgi:engulfment/cell motility protein 1
MPCSIELTPKRLIPTSANNILKPHILSFQSRYAAILNHRRLRAVRPDQHAEQNRMIEEIWQQGRLAEVERGMELVQTEPHATARSPEGWRRIGLHVEDGGDEGDGLSMYLETELFKDVGDLGLECLVRLWSSSLCAADDAALLCSPRRELSCRMC